tara:strand:- start:364 stop:2610 length:2247 start_codon:yes stop_codon:yes gene_type:complete
MSRYDSYGAVDDQMLDVFDTRFNGFNNRLKSDSLQEGILTDSKNFRFDLQGIAQVRKGITVTKAPLALDANRAFTIPFYVYGDPNDSTSTSNNLTSQTLSAGSLVGTTLTITFASDHYIQDDTLIFVGAISGVTGYSSGNYKATRNSATSISITVDGIGGTPSGTTTVGAPAIQASFTTQVYGSCNYSDFFNDGVEYIILAGNDKAYAIKLSDQSTTEISYQSGVQISSRVDMIQALNRIYIFRDGQTALEFDGDLSSSPTFNKVSSGPFTQPVLLDSSNNTTILNGKVSVAETGHGLETGDEIVVVDSGHATLTDGSSYTITKVDADNFFFFADVDDDTSSHSSKFIGRVSAGGGYIHMPAPPFAVAHNFRLAVPYFYEPSTTDNFTARNVDDEILVSSPKRGDKYDTPFGTFGTTEGGVNDKLVGLFSFADDKLLLFNRKSISLVQGIDSVNFSDTTRQLITSELGLVARKSVVQVGNNVLFLSDNGVYGASFQDLYNLRGNETPLSEAINPTFERINKAYWENSVAVYFNNRYYLAVPLNDEDGTEATSNNAILIFNFLNKQWESVDSVGSTSRQGNTINFDIQDLIVAGNGSDRAVYVVNTLGGVHKLDSSTNDVDFIISQVGQSEQTVPISSEITTREYNANTIDRKKWNSYEIQVQSSPELSSDFRIDALTTNIDNEKNLGTYSSIYGSNLPEDEDVSIRGRIGNLRAYGLRVKITPLEGRPQFKIIKASGAQTFKSNERAI